ncbi:InlB B-repeat-containing protein [Nibribacter koreensis]|uniref:Pectate lyase domain-containing protein n=1 Tax=Nibribacter koreensis TaxID=1084519 RepID=A0ABP8FCB7_9BACT
MTNRELKNRARKVILAGGGAFMLLLTTTFHPVKAVPLLISNSLEVTNTAEGTSATSISRFFRASTVRITATATAGTGLCSFDGSIRVTNTSISVINISNTAGKGVTWKVEVTTPGTYQLQWNYAGGGSAALEVARLLVNQAIVSETVSFLKPKDSNTFLTTELVPVTLAKGVNEIKIESTANAPLGDIAWMEITGEDPIAADCSQAIGSGGNDDPNATFALSASANPAQGGTVTVNPNASTYAKNTVVTVTATPAPGYVFTGWGGNATGTSPTTAVTMNSEKSVIANFALDNSPTAFQITATTRGEGTVSPASQLVDKNGTVTLTATAAAGWQFIGWSGDTTGAVNPLTVRMNSAKTITANFFQGTPPAINNAMTGYASTSGEGYTTTTGGQGGRIIQISTLAELEAWAASRERNSTPEIVHISGKISSPATMVVTIKDGANISILGVGATAELQNVGLNIREYKNVIVRNLKLHEVFYPNDALTIDESQHVWVDHCEFYSKIGAGIGVDTYDGLLDIKKGSRYVTVSWSYFHDHMKNVLIGHTDNAAAEAEDRAIRVTFHHNYFSNTDGRNPSLRWGAAHLYNNYFKNITDYGLALRQGAHGLIENNVYENVKLPISTNKFDGEGFACERGNLFIGTSGANSITQTDCAWWNTSNLTYSYDLDPVETVFALVPANVGVGKVDVTGTVMGGKKDQGQLNRQLRVYPNPATDEAVLELTLSKTEMVKITLQTLGGVKVGATLTKTIPAGVNRVAYKTNSLKAGVYLVQVETSEGAIRQRLVIQ